ncbi:ABC transporter ATP-binding protein/permease [Alcaligenaceae bacterium A4P071]|nr:ABC transporter ATP-binding protein/permease [Alcaligenaceae bacterium A4P071]
MTSPKAPQALTTWQLIRPFWVSDERWAARGLIAAIIAMNLTIVYINVRLNAWNAGFYNALEGKQVEAFGGLLWTFTWLAFSFIILAVYSLYLRQALGFRWRQWMTRRYIHEWLGDHAFYRIERDGTADNPDQRIADDLQGLATTTLSLFLDLISTVVTLVSFMSILWTLGGAASIVLATYQIDIPGYMVWAAMVYALVGSVLIKRFGAPLVAINYRQQQVEADFRFGLIRVRENAEQIALYGGAHAEGSDAGRRFGHIRDNWRRIMSLTKRLTFMTSMYSQAAIILPLSLATPHYFAGAYSFGVLIQVARAFGTVSDSLSWFILNYATLAEWRATVNRLREFKLALARGEHGEHGEPSPQPSGPSQVESAPTPLFVPTPMHASGQASSASLSSAAPSSVAHPPRALLHTQSLHLQRPDGSPLVAIPDFRVMPGERWLIKGASGIGKSTLLRAVAGLWPYRTGAVVVAENMRMLFVPQQSYMPIGTLKAALCYPDMVDRFDDASCATVLELCGLGAFISELLKPDHWGRRLSPGEQQRVGFARVLLQRPQMAFLDESTSALDLDTERRLYRVLIEQLPKTAIMSVAHRESLADFHPRTLTLRADDAATIRSAPDAGWNHALVVG